ncbi:MAG: MBL fold metallo-hydrolase [Deferrisomatales bacterium]|nr:MBL fold metallo-hydrolase [Deferrisomatales bacterium]
MRVTAVGTGTCVPRRDRRGPCALVEARGTRVAVDLGLGSLHGLLEAGVEHRHLDAVLFTHLHADHVAELSSLLFAANYDEEPRERPLLLAGGPGFGDFLRGLSALFGTWLQPRAYRLEVRELVAGQTLSIGALVCRTGGVRHIPSSLAYRFELEERAAVISGDTGPSPELEELARGADLLLLEASTSGERPVPVHLSPAQAGELARSAAVGRLVLTHLYPSADRAGPGPAAAAAFGKEVLVARDGMTLEIPWGRGD